MLVRHEAIEDALQSEISHHIECETTDLIRRCTPPDLARRQALLAALAGVRLADVDVDRRLVLLVTTTATLMPTVRGIRHAPLSVLREP